jgi:hypothetical protein
VTAPDDSIVRVTDGRDGTAFIWLPDVDYLDTQAGPVEVGLDRDIAKELFHALGAWLASPDGLDFQIAGDWGVEGGGDTAEKTLAKLARLHSRYPTSHVRASKRVAVIFEDDSAYYGPWHEFDSETTEEHQ